MKKILAILLSLALVFAFVACGGSDSSEPAATDGEATEPAADEQTYELVLGGVTPDPAKDGETKFVELIEEYSNGTVTCQDFPDNSLGDDLARLEMCINGECDIAIGASANYTSILNDFYLFDIYFFFLNKQEVYDVGFAGEAAKVMQDSAESAGVKVVSMWENGFRDLTTNREIKTLADFKGLKIRVMENEVHLAIWSALGANPSPLAFGELYTALQQKTFDAQENPLELIYNTKFYEVQPYVYLTNHIYTAYLCFMNAGLYDSLNADTQALVKECAVEATAYQRTLCEAASNKCADEINASGKSHTYDVDPALLADIQGSLGDVYALVKEKSGIPDLVEAYYNAL